MEVSIVIVCMNKPEQLRVCLESIRRETSVSYEIIVVAYLFSEENLARLRADYPDIRIVESRELRGFSENNNLGLALAEGEYCFIVNDDTWMEMPVIDALVADLRNHPEADAVQPAIFYPDGRRQTCGRGPWTPGRYLRHYLGLVDETKPTQWTWQEGFFRTWSLNGACFLIRTEVFRSIGWFDETYTFTPEDVALGTLLSRRGYGVYADADVRIVHIANATASALEAAIKPTRVRGSLIFYSSLSHLDSPQGADRCNRLVYAGMGLFVGCYEALRCLKYSLIGPGRDETVRRRRALMHRTARNVLRSLFTRKLPKEIFTDLYHEIKGQ